MHASSALALLFLAALVPAQVRVFIGGVPTNLSLDLSSTAVVPDPSAGDAFFALMPIQWPQNFAVFDSVTTMNVTYGSGNWLRCRMEATHWAYLSNDACAHQPAPGATVPRSFLTSSYDLGASFGHAGTPNMPWPGATLFTGIGWSVLSGLDVLHDPFGGIQERWALHARHYVGFAWNACPYPTPYGLWPNFSGWLIARFTFSFV